MAVASQKLRGVNNFSSLVSYLRNELHWPIETDNWDDLTFEYDPEKLGLQKEYGNAIHKLWQLRPLDSRQPWGIFFVEFKKKKLPVVVLRRILRGLVINKRATAKAAEKPSWAADDLLFISALGDEKERELTFAHFKTSEADLPTLRVLEWDGGDTIRKLEFLDDTLHRYLVWPEDTGKAKEWLESWSRPFRHRPGHTIRTAKELAEALAHMAIRIREAVKTVMKAESDRGKFRTLHKAFRESLIHDLEQDEFADTYAQTITYGLLTAAISRTDMSAGKHGTAVIVENVADMVPITNPFLKEILQEFLLAGGRKGKLDFDELGVQDVAELLRGEDTDLPAVIRDFGNQTRGEDPVIHFYEHFLAAYDKAQKKQRGVFYTPQPVVSYIVRSVHELLQTEFGLHDGLADTTTWGEMLKKHPGMKLPMLTDEPGEKRTISPDEPFVQILDPATGTATFLVEVIDVIHKTLSEKWGKEGLSKNKQNEAWNDYVPKHLLPRLHAFELMMAPYAIAHMKFGLKLAETGYRFGAEERARIYLTNALEPKVKQLPQIGFDALAHEAAAVNEIKWYKRFTIVIGNPPYAGHSANKGEWITRLIKDYYFVDGIPLGERNPKYLNDDYVKFIRFSQSLVAETGVGILGFITNHGYLENPTFRGMRQSLLKTFPSGFITDLHGNGNKQERAPDGGKDENVFDILQGVSIGLFLRGIQLDRQGLFHRDLWGERGEKYKTLQSQVVVSHEVVLKPTSPNYYFFPQNNLLAEEYSNGWPANHVFVVCSLGPKSHRDDFAIAFDKSTAQSRLADLKDQKMSDDAIRKKYEINDTRDWHLSSARKKSLAAHVIHCMHRPFDFRFMIYGECAFDWPRPEVNDHLLRPNMALAFTRQTKEDFSVLVLGVPASQHKIVAAYDSSYISPLYAYDTEDNLLSTHSDKSKRQANFSVKFRQAFSARLCINSEADGTLTPENIFHYAYAVFHSPCYRTRYAEFLKIDFPRLPLTRNLELFRALARLGGELTALHLLESPKLAQPITEFIGSRNPQVEKVSWSKNTVWIDKAQTIGFKGVREDVWKFHIGGYQVCERWLKDRKDRKLTKDDIAHYQKVIVALSETIRLVKEIDAVVDTHGGWPLR